MARSLGDELPVFCLVETRIWCGKGTGLARRGRLVTGEHGACVKEVWLVEPVDSECIQVKSFVDTGVDNRVLVWSLHLATSQLVLARWCGWQLRTMDGDPIAKIS